MRNPAADVASRCIDLAGMPVAVALDVDELRRLDHADVHGARYDDGATDADDWLRGQAPAGDDDAMSYGASHKTAAAEIPTEAERRAADRRARRDRRDQAKAPVTPGVIFGFGVFIALVGSALLYVLTAMEKGDDELRSFLIIVQFAAWAIGGYMIVIAGIAWAVAVGIRSARDD